jgi:hypothetical protein
MQVLKVDVSQKKQEFVAAIKPEKTPPSSC